MRPLPNFVSNLAIWDYTQTKFNLDYEEWGPKEFAKAQRVYNASLLKYGKDLSSLPTSNGEIQNNKVLNRTRRECASCEQPNTLFYVGDYMCSHCRDKS